MDIHSEMTVTKRNGDCENVSFDKILLRIKKIGKEHNINLGFSQLCLKVIDQLYNKIETSKIDELMAEQCASLISDHPDYGLLASAISVSNLHKNTPSSFFACMQELWNFTDKNGCPSPLISQELWDIVNANSNLLESIIDYKRDYLLDFFGLKTLERAYLMRVNKNIVERPAHMWLRVAIGIHGSDLEKVQETYDYMSRLYFTHATPTLFNAGTPRPQLSSCFLMSMKDDSIDGIYDTLKQCANISKWAGGIGLHIHQIRGTGSHIRGTNGVSNGIVPMLRNFNETARYVDQGGGKRNGSFAIYISPWHSDIFEFLELKKNHGDENSRARDLFYGLWIPDEFMRQVKSDGDWYLCCPDVCPGLDDVVGDDFVALYNKYIAENKYVRKVKAREVWLKILDSQMETGNPYLLYSDACNLKSNQQNLGVIKSSNLCTEIVEYSSPEETAVCNLASISLSKCVKPRVSHTFKHLKVYTMNDCKWCTLLKILLKKCDIEYEEIIIQKEHFEEWKLATNLNTVPQVMNGDEVIGGYMDTLKILRRQFDFNLLHKITKIVARNLDKVIDVNFYPTPQTRRSNLLHRPIGIGVQGLADAFALMELPFDSPESRELNKRIFETIYHAAIETSCDIAKERVEGMTILREALDNDRLCFDDYNDPCCRNISGLAKDYIGRNADISVPIIPTTYRNLIDKYHPTYYETLKLQENHLGAYSSFEGSPMSKGIFQFDMWGVEPSDAFDWNKLRRDIMQYGIRNSLSLAPMPTASTSQILGNNECFEPFTSNIYSRRTLAGDFSIVNKHLVTELIELGIWNKQVKDNIILNKGSVQGLVGVPQYIKDKYKIVWELSMKSLIDMAADRGAFICQSMSMNLWMEDPNYGALTTMHFYAWSKGLKTGVYYLRRKPKHTPQQFTIEPEKKDTSNEEEECLMCGA